jgi:hypothetical protein
MKKRMVFLRSGVLVLAVLLTVSGCESFRRKFTRTKKRGKAAEETIIVAPRDYSAHPFPNDVMYKQYFTYWKAWNQEWVVSLNDKDSHKKIVGCAEQSLANLEKMRTYLVEEKQKELDVFVEKTRALKDEIAAHKSLMPSQYASYQYRAERVLSAVNRQFDMRHVSESIR